MKKKGFTLIELLAVIIVLGVIALITVPIITDTVNKSKIEAFKDTASGILNTAKQTYLEYSGETMRVNMEDYVIRINGSITNTKMVYTGSSPKNGYVEINAEGEATLIVYNEFYCAYKVNSTDNIQVKEINSPSECTLEVLKK